MRSKYISSVDKGVTKAGETNDCFVRAVTNVSQLPYDVIHSITKKHGRKDCKGTSYVTCVNVLKELDFECIGVFGKTGSARVFNTYIGKNEKVHQYEGITLERFVESLPFGEYVVFVRGHATSVINGKIVDTFDNKAGKRVVAAFRKKDAELV